MTFSHYIAALQLILSTDCQAVSLREAVERVWERSPLVREGEVQAKLASGDRWRRFIPNEPQLQYTNTDSGTAQSFGLSETVSLPFKTLALTEVDSAKAKSQRAELDAKRYDMARLTINAYVDCALAEASARQQEKLIADTETLEKSLRARYEAGSAAQAETIGVDLQLRQARADLTLASDRAAVLCEKLDRHLELETKTGHELPDDVPPAIIDRIGAKTADESRALASVLNAEAASGTAWWSQVPDLTVGVAANHYFYLPGSPSGQANSVSFTASITIPLLFPFHESIDAQRAKSQAAIDRNTAELQLASLRADKKDAARAFVNGRARLRELRDRDLALAEALVESTFSAYRTGKLGFAELVLAKKTLSDLRAQEIQLRGSVINARLRCLTGCENEEKK